MKLLFVPFHTVISHSTNHVTVSLNCTVTVNGDVFVGLLAGVERVTVGTVVSTVNEFTLSVDDTFPAVSVTVIVQFVCAPLESVLNVTVLFPLVALVVPLLQSHP